MAKRMDYAQKFESLKTGTLYDSLHPSEREFIRQVAFAHRLTFQEFRQVVEASRDLAMWGEGSVCQWWQTRVGELGGGGNVTKSRLLDDLAGHLRTMKSSPTRYTTDEPAVSRDRERRPVVTEKSGKKIWGMCPVASDKTVCCNLRTIDAVENCVFGCSYCSVQTFYQKEIVFDRDFVEKLKDIPVDPDRFYHFGTGQASDSLAWGNRNGILDALCQFAADHANVLLELKTKSDNVRYFLSRRDIPKNVVCSWSLNTPTVIANEEHFTADFGARIRAARSVADRGVQVAFHFHPMVYYDGWKSDYVEAASAVKRDFAPEEVLFISLGSVTLIKPVINKIRKLGQSTKILQVDWVPDPHGKLTYRDEIKVAMFKTMYESFRPWREKVFLYLCMEKASVWEKAFGYVYRSNEEFERNFGLRTMPKSRASA